MTSSIPESKIQSTILSKFADVSFLSSITNVLLYNGDLRAFDDTGTGIFSFIRDFVLSLKKDIQTGQLTLSITPSHINNILDLIYKLNVMKEDINASLVHYDNVSFHLSEVFKKNPSLKSFVQNVIDNKITDANEFKNELDNITKTIQLYNEVKSIRQTLNKLDYFIYKCQSEDSSAYDVIAEFRKLIIDMQGSVSALKTVTKDELDDYIIISRTSGETEQDESVKPVDVITEKLLNFFISGYTFSKSGYDIIDSTIGGIESNTVHIISGPTNHGKSIFMLNLCRNMALHCESKSKENVIVFITLEDDIYRLLRRYFSIFGNYDSSAIRELFIKFSTELKEKKYKDIKSSTEGIIFRKIIDKIYNNCVADLGNVSVVLKHSFEDSFSPKDASIFLDELKIQGYNPIALFIDYLDVMIPSYMYTTKKDDYNVQGQIVHELRRLCKHYQIPVITASQNKRESEDVTRALENNQAGDSHKKVRYADFMYMIRKRDDLDVYNEIISQDIKNYDNIINNKNPFDRNEENKFLDVIVPFEVKITKSKDGSKGVRKFHLFNLSNLRIYDDIRSCKIDYQNMVNNSSQIVELISHLELSLDDVSSLSLLSGEAQGYLI